MNTQKLAYIILIALILLVILIYLFHNRIELFTDAITIQKSNNIKNPIINLPANDIHFITDNNPKLINTIIFNYKLMINIDTTNTLTESNTQLSMPLSTQYNIPQNTQTNTPQNTQSMQTNTSIINSIQKENFNMQSSTPTLKYLSVFQHKPYNTYTGIGQYVSITDKPFDDS